MDIKITTCMLLLIIAIHASSGMLTAKSLTMGGNVATEADSTGASDSAKRKRNDDEKLEPEPSTRAEIAQRPKISLTSLTSQKSTSMIDDITDKVLADHGVVGGMGTIHAVEALIQRKEIPSDEAIHSMGAMAKRQGVPITDDQMTLATNAAKLLRTGEGNKAELLRDAVSSLNLISGENAAIASEGLEAANEGNFLGIGSALAKGLIGPEALQAGRDLHKALSGDSESLIRGVGSATKILRRHVMRSSLVPPPFKAGMVMVNTGIQAGGEYARTGSLSAAAIAAGESLTEVTSIFPGGASTFRILGNATKAYKTNGNMTEAILTAGKVEIANQAAGMLEHIPLVGGMASSMASSMVRSAIVGDSAHSATALESASEEASDTTATAATTIATSTAVKEYHSQFTPEEVKILKMMIAEYGKRHHNRIEEEPVVTKFGKQSIAKHVPHVEDDEVHVTMHPNHANYQSMNGISEERETEYTHGHNGGHGGGAVVTEQEHVKSEPSTTFAESTLTEPESHKSRTPRQIWAKNIPRGAAVAEAVSEHEERLTMLDKSTLTETGSPKSHKAIRNAKKAAHKAAAAEAVSEHEEPLTMIAERTLTETGSPKSHEDRRITMKAAREATAAEVLSTKQKKNRERRARIAARRNAAALSLQS